MYRLRYNGDVVAFKMGRRLASRPLRRSLTTGNITARSMESVGNFPDRRTLLIILMSLIAGSALETARTQTVAPPDPPPVAVAASPVPASPVPANPFESEVSSLEAKLLQSPIASSPIVFYGSSSIRLWKSLQQDFSGYAVLNCGFGGSRLTDCVRYANRLVLPRKPSAIVIYAGDNDLAAAHHRRKFSSRSSNCLPFFAVILPRYRSHSSP